MNQCDLFIIYLYRPLFLLLLRPDEINRQLQHTLRKGTQNATFQRYIQLHWTKSDNRLTTIVRIITLYKPTFTMICAWM